MKLPPMPKERWQDTPELVQAFRAGDPEAFQKLYNAYARGVYRFCLRLLGDATAAEDAFQDTWLRAYEHRHELRSDGFRVWLFRIAYRVCLNCRRQRRECQEFDEELAPGSLDVNTDPYLREHIRRALERLPERLRAVVLLRIYEECSYEEIAAILGIEVGAARVRMHRARLLLRRWLAAIVQDYNGF
ncbi:ECF RNA polymerase sigma factor SigW [bacterium HR21]|nr:ECF RNA polymerase sigma factor SigW [bacterium HR21]